MKFIISKEDGTHEITVPSHSVIIVVEPGEKELRKMLFDFILAFAKDDKDNHEFLQTVFAGIDSFKFSVH